MGTLHVVQYTFFILSCSILPIMRKVSNKSFRESQNTHFVFGKGFPRPKSFG